MRAQQFAGLFIENSFDQPLIIAHGNRLAIADKRKAPDPDLMAGIPGGSLSHPDGGYLRPAIGAAWHRTGSKRMDLLQSGNFLDADDTLMAGLVRQPWRPGHITNGIDAGLPRCRPFIGDNMPTVNSNGALLKAQILGIAGNADRHDGPLGDKIGAAPLKAGSDLVTIAGQAAQPGTGDNPDATLGKSLLHDGRNLCILDRQDIVHRLNQRHLNAHIMVEGRKFGTDRA